MSETNKTTGLLSKGLGLGRWLLPAASVIGIEATKLIALGEQGGPHKIALGVGCITVGELLRWWHTYRVGKEANEATAADAEKWREANSRHNEHLTKAVGRTIGNILRNLKVVDLDRVPIGKLAAGAEEYFRIVKQEGLVGDDLEDEILPEVIEKSVDGEDRPWGKLVEWEALLKAMAERASLELLPVATLPKAAEACRDTFAQQFLNTIKTDLENKGAAFASIHLRMMAQLVFLAKAEGAASLRLEGKLDGLLEFVEKQTVRIVKAAKERGEFEEVSKLAEYLGDLDASLKGIKFEITRLGDKIDGQTNLLVSIGNRLEEFSGEPKRVKKIQLPRPHSIFVGRDDWIASVVPELERASILTLLGPGGIGKTQCAINIAMLAAPGFDDGVCFISLAGEPATTAIARPVLAGLRRFFNLSPLTPEDVPTDGAISSLVSDRRLLLVLDNLEHHVGQAASIQAWLDDGCPKLTVLVTSRTTLNLTNEIVRHLPPLEVPQDFLKKITASATYANNACMELFEKRAQSRLPSFRITEGNIHDVATICTWLEGIPLAIVLVASSVVSGLLPHDMVRKWIGADAHHPLQTRLETAATGLRGLEARHQSLRRAMQCSYDLLSTEQKRLLANLTVFRTGFTQAMAEHVCNWSAEFGENLGRILKGLSESSWLAEEIVGDRVRFSILDTIREFARTQISAEELRVYRERHIRWLRTYTNGISQDCDYTDRQQGEEFYKMISDNFDEAISWYQTESQVQSGTELQQIRAAYRASAMLARIAPSREEKRKSNKPEDLIDEAATARMKGRHDEAKDLANRAKVLLDNGGAPEIVSDLHYELALIALSDRKFDEAIAEGRSAYESAKNSPEQRCLYNAYYLLGSINKKIGNRAEAQENFGRAIAVAQGQRELFEKIQWCGRFDRNALVIHSFHGLDRKHVGRAVDASLVYSEEHLMSILPGAKGFEQPHPYVQIFRFEEGDSYYQWGCSVLEMKELNRAREAFEAARKCFREVKHASFELATLVMLRFVITDDSCMTAVLVDSLRLSTALRHRDISIGTLAALAMSFYVHGYPNDAILLASGILRHVLQAPSDSFAHYAVPQLQKMVQEARRERGEEGASRVLLGERMALDQLEVYVLDRNWPARGPIDLEIADCSAVLATPDAPPDKKAHALVHRGIIYGKLGKIELEIADYSAALAMTDATSDPKAHALINRGIAYGKRGEIDLEIEDYSALLATPNVPSNLTAKALINRGIVYGNQGNADLAIADYSAVVAMGDVSHDATGEALHSRGVNYFRQGKRDLAIADFSAAVEISDASARLKAEVLYNRGVVYSDQNRLDLAIADYSAVLALSDPPVDQKAKALLNRSRAYEKQGKTDLAVADYSAVLAMPDAPAEPKAKALLTRGVAVGREGENDLAIADFTAILVMSDAPALEKAWALLQRGIAYGRQEKRDLGISDFSAILAMPDAPAEERAKALLVRGHFYHLLSRTDLATADYSAVLAQIGAPAKILSLAEEELSKLQRGTTSQP